MLCVSYKNSIAPGVASAMSSLSPKVKNIKVIKLRAQIAQIENIHEEQLMKLQGEFFHFKSQSRLHQDENISRVLSIAGM